MPNRLTADQFTEARGEYEQDMADDLVRALNNLIQDKPDLNGSRILCPEATCRIISMARAYAFRHVERCMNIVTTSDLGRASIKRLITRMEKEFDQ